MSILNTAGVVGPEDVVIGIENQSDWVSCVQVDAAVVSFKLKPPSEYPQVSSSKSFFSMVALFSSIHSHFSSSISLEVLLHLNIMLCINYWIFPIAIC